MIIHRYWTGPEHEHDLWLANAVRSMHPRDELIDWTDDTLPASISALLVHADEQVIVEHVGKHRANIVRWALLREHGGMWLDHDVVPFVRLTAIPGPWVASTRGVPSSCALLFSAGHELPSTMLAFVAEQPANPSARSPQVSGDGVLARLITRDVAHVKLPFDAHGTPMSDGFPPKLLPEWHTERRTST